MTTIAKATTKGFTVGYGIGMPSSLAVCVSVSICIGRILALGILVLAVLYFLFTSNMIPDGQRRPTFGDGRTPWYGRDTVTMPTIDNPMANVLYTDYTDRPDRPAAAWYPSGPCSP